MSEESRETDLMVSTRSEMVLVALCKLAHSRSVLGVVWQGSQSGSEPYANLDQYMRSELVFASPHSTTLAIDHTWPSHTRRRRIHVPPPLPAITFGHAALQLDALLLQALSGDHISSCFEPSKLVDFRLRWDSQCSFWRNRCKPGAPRSRGSCEDWWRAGQARNPDDCEREPGRHRGGHEEG